MEWTDEELLIELERRAYESRIKDHYSWAADYKRGFIDGLGYGLVWSGRLQMSDVDSAIGVGRDNARADLAKG